jgi:hypothetical protein
MRKLLQATGERQWSGKMYRWSKNVFAPYCMVGGTITLTYQLVFDFMRHHEETNSDRPLFFDHMLACSILGTGIGAFAGAMPRFWFTGFFVGGFIVAPMTWWMYIHGRLNAQNRPTNMFYENSVTPEEIERIQHTDMLEALGS